MLFRSIDRRWLQKDDRDSPRSWSKAHVTSKPTEGIKLQQIIEPREKQAIEYRRDDRVIAGGQSNRVTLDPV